MQLNTHAGDRKKDRIIPAIIQDCNGNTMIEFAIVGPVTFFLVMAIIEISLILYAQTVLEGAAFSASRTGKTGYVADAASREETIIAKLNQHSHSLLDSTKIDIETKVYNEFDQIGEPEPFIDANMNGKRDDGENYTDVNGNGQYDEDMALAGLGSASQVVVYNITYPWQIYTPLIAQFFGELGNYNLTTQAIIRNEPY